VDIITGVQRRRRYTAEEKVRELERLLGRKTMEAEILREALEQARPRQHALRSPSPPPGGSR
jgi:transposase